MQTAILKSSALPTVSLRANFHERRVENEVTSTSGELTVNVPLYTTALKPTLEIAESEVKIGELQLLKAQQDLYRRVVIAYFEILAAQDDLDTTTSEVKAITEFLKVTKTRFEVGLGTNSDIQNATAREALARAAEIRDESAIENAWLSLIEIIGSRPDQLNRLEKDLTMPVLMPDDVKHWVCLLYTSPSPRDRTRSRMPSSA